MTRPILGTPQQSALGQEPFGFLLGPQGDLLFRRSAHFAGVEGADRVSYGPEHSK